MRSELLTKLDQLLGKAIEDKSISILQAIIKDLHILFKEYSGADKRVQAEYFESYQVFTL
jgi:rRNA-processing protein FCF1